MTLILEVAPEVENRWREIAARDGRAVEEVAAQAAAIGFETLEKENQDAPPRRQLKARGQFAHINVTSENVHRSRREEVERDEAKFQARWGKDK